MSSDSLISIERSAIAAMLAELRELQTRIERLTAQVEALNSPAPASAARPEAAAGPRALAGPQAPPAAPARPWVERRPPIHLQGAGQPLLTNGVDIKSGGYLLEIDSAAAKDLASKHTDSDSLTRLHKSKWRTANEQTFGMVAGYNESLLADTRWAVVVHAWEDVAVLKALTPLIVHRADQQGITLNPAHLQFSPGQNCGTWYNALTREKDHGRRWLELPPVMIYRPATGGDSSVAPWLARYGASQGPVDPRRGVPYYLMLAGRPGPLNPADQAYIPYAFQYELDIFWGVGRLCFSDQSGGHDLAAYTEYAERVVAFEQRQDAADRLRKEIVYFGTDHGPGDATAASARELIAPLSVWHDTNDRTGPGVRLGFSQQIYLGGGAELSVADRAIRPAGPASRSNLELLLGGGADGRPPAVLFSATHGAGVLSGSAEEVLANQGALITQGWSRGSTRREDWFAGSDLSAQAKVEGMIALLFACYGAGSPSEDEYVFDPAAGRASIAPFPFVAQLPQRLLRSGALAVLGHVDRAWTYAFRGTATASAQSQSFEDVLFRIAEGKPLGYATDQFNVVQAAHATKLADELADMRFGKITDEFDLATLWVARNDARNYALLGDPAVRLPFPPAPGAASS